MMFEKLKIDKNLYLTDPRCGCGPSLIPVEHVKKLLETGPYLLGTGHRKNPVKKLIKEIQEGIKNYFSLSKDFKVLLGNGGATLLFDMIGLGFVDKNIQHFTCGEFSKKWYRSSKLIPWINTYEETREFGEGFDFTNYHIEENIDVACLTLNETSTGVQMYDLPKYTKKKTLLAIDATSGAGQMICDINKTDIFFFSPQKVFSSEGGLFVCILSPEAQERAVSSNKQYIPAIMNWKTAIQNSEENQIYNTPALATLFFLNEQIKKMNRVGFPAILEDGYKKAKLIYSWANEKDYLSPYVKKEKFRSSTVAAIDVVDSIDVKDLLHLLVDQKVVFGIESYRKLGKNQFRIALFYNILYSDLKKLITILSNAIEDQLAE